MFYQMFSGVGVDPTASNPKIPLLIWLQGGPGSSSQFGCHTEVGPVRVINGTAKANGNSWNFFGHLVCIDSPLNVGFSWAKGDRKGKVQVNSTDTAGNHLVNFLYNFYQTWPKLLDSPLVITGESFAGHYIPVLARKILSNQTKLGFTVHSVAIGDGWTDPINQINFYDTYLWSVGVIDRGFRDTCTWFQTNGIVNIYEGDYQKATDYFDFITNNDTTPKTYMGGISIFNFRDYGDLDESFVKILEDNKARFGIAKDVEFIAGNDQIYTAFGKDITRSVADDVAYILGQIKVLIYNGQNDVVVNTPGVLQYLNSLQWSEIWRWKRAPKTVWTVGKEVVGWSKVGGNLWFVLVNNAGHMVPTDQPTNTMIMMGHFLND